MTGAKVQKKSLYGEGGAASAGLPGLGIAEDKSPISQPLWVIDLQALKKGEMGGRHPKPNPRYLKQNVVGRCFANGF
jgi:hypothetical protein